jgi:hypothetical protein
VCGIFGVVLRARSGMEAAHLEGLVSALFKLSESRGREAAGLAIQCAGGRRVHKAAVSASQMIRSGVYRRAFDETLGANGAHGRHAANTRNGENGEKGEKGESPAAQELRPGPWRSRPAANDQRPTTNHQRPAASSQRLSSHGLLSPVNVKEPNSPAVTVPLSRLPSTSPA